jgi:hypothetical protein
VNVSVAVALLQRLLNANDQTLRSELETAPGDLSFSALGDGLSFVSPSLGSETEITGPIAAKLHISSTTVDADLFLVCGSS